MAKPRPERLSLETYAVVLETAPRFGDLDPLHHLNNSALTRIYEDGRVRFLDSSGVRAGWERGCRFVVAEVAIQYLQEGHYPDALTLGTGVSRIGASSFTLSQGLFQNGQCIGVGDTALVYVEAATGKSRPLPQACRESMLASALRTGLVEPAAAHSNSQPLSKKADVENA